MPARAPRAQVFLADFGLAKDVATGSKFTRSGTTLGTPAYMSPEQARGEFGALTAASDVWALGCLCFETAAGRPPFQGETPAAVIGAVLTSRPALDAVPDGAAGVVDACLRQDAGSRPQSGAVLRDLCERALQGRLPRPRQGRRWTTPALAAASLALAAVGVWWTWPENAPATVATTGQPTASDRAEQAWQLRTSELPRAVSMMREALTAGPERFDLRLQLGWLLWLAQDPEAAHREWAQVPHDHPLRARATALRAVELCGRSVRSHNVAHATEAAVLCHQAGPAALAATPTLRAVVMLESGKPGEAWEELAGTAEPEAALLRVMISEELGAAWRTPPPEQVERLCSELIDAGLPFVWVVATRASCRLSMGDLASARRDADRAIQIDPDHAGAYLVSSQLHQIAGDHALALDDVERAIALDPDRPEAWGVLARYHRITGDQAAAERAASEAIRRRPGYPVALVVRAKARLELADPAGALRDCTAAIGTNPNIADAYYVRAKASGRLGDQAAALRDLDRALTLRANWPPALAERGKARLRTGDLAGALVDLDAVLATRTNHLEARVNRAIVRLRLKDPEGAHGDADRALELDPAQPQALLARAAAREALDDPAGQLADLEALLAANPDHTTGLAAIARVLTRRGEWQRAATYLERYLSLTRGHRRDAEMRQLLALCLEQLGRRSGGD